MQIGVEINKIIIQPIIIKKIKQLEQKMIAKQSLESLRARGILRVISKSGENESNSSWDKDGKCIIS